MRGRGLIALLSVVLVVVAAGMAYYLFYPTDSARKSGVNQALVSFHEEMKKAAGYPRHSGAAIPPFGVYRYSTRGSEEIESTAFGTGHRYGAVTGITLTPTRCGVKERWQPLVESWTEGELCLAPQTSRVVAVRNFHEFFGESKLVHYSCVGGSALYSAKLRPEMRWVTRCRSDTGTVASDVRVVGLGKIKVAGMPIEAVHLHSAVRLSGDPAGIDTQNSWLRRSDGLLLRRTESSKAHVDAGGGSEFNEHYEIALISTKPQR
jgi:hypothetical protein